MVHDSSTAGLVSAVPLLERLKRLTETAVAKAAAAPPAEGSIGHRSGEAADKVLLDGLHGGHLPMDVGEEEGNSEKMVRRARISASTLTATLVTKGQH